MKKCNLCKKMKKAQNHAHTGLVIELITGYVILRSNSKHQGYTLFICKKHESKLHKLGENFKKFFLEEMAIVAECIWQAFQPAHLDYKLLSSQDTHLCWKFIPYHENDGSSGKKTPLKNKLKKIGQLGRKDDFQSLKDRLRKEIEKKVSYRL